MTAPVPVPVPLPWAQTRIDAAERPIPDYGTPEWAALPDDSRAKIAAVIVAAECWRTSSDPAWRAWRLWTELNPPDEPAVWTPEVVEQVHRAAVQPSYEELCRRRGEPEREARASVHRRRLGLPVELSDAPVQHTDGRPVSYRRTRRQTLQAVRDA